MQRIVNSANLGGLQEVSEEDSSSAARPWESSGAALHRCSSPEVMGLEAD